MLNAMLLWKLNAQLWNVECTAIYESWMQLWNVAMKVECTAVKWIIASSNVNMAVVK